MHGRRGGDTGSSGGDTGDPSEGDGDGDGLTDVQEGDLGTDPENGDSDNDGAIAVGDILMMLGQFGNLCN